MTPLTSVLHSLDDRASRSHRNSLLLIILLGLLLRWFSVYEGHAFIYFAINDEISALQYAFGFMHGASPMWYLGQPALNQGHIPGPLWSIFVTGLYKLGGNSVEGAVYIMALLNTLVIYLVYLLAGKLMPARYALLSALFYAVSPWAIYYAAGLYNPMALALFGALLYLSLWQTLAFDYSRAVFWVMLLSAAIPQIHMIGLFYYPAILLLLIINPCRLNRRWLFAGILAGCLLYLPYLIGEITHHWSNLHGILTGSTPWSSGILKILTIPIGMLTNHPGEWAGYSAAEQLAFAKRWYGSYWVLIGISLISLLLSLIFLGSFLHKTYTLLRTSRFNLRTAFSGNNSVFFISVLLILPLLFYILTGRAYTTRYSIIIYPLLFLLPAMYIAGIKHPRFKRIIVYALFATFIANIYLTCAFYVDQNHRINSAQRFMPAFDKLRALSTALQKDAGPDTRIEVDTSRYRQSGNKYSKIAAAAVSDYIGAFQDYRKKSKAHKTRQYTLVTSTTNVPGNAKIVYRDNGLVVYTR